MPKQRSPQLPKQWSAGGGNSRVNDPGHVHRLVNEGARLLAAKRPAEAVIFLTRAWELDPQNAGIAINLGGAYILQGKHKMAVPILEAASRLEPDNPMVWTNLAAAYLGKLPFAGSKDQDLAIAAYKKVLALDPQAPHVHYNLGLIYFERQDLSQASAYFHDALAVNPDDRDARFWLEKIGRSVIGAQETAD